MMKLVKKAAMCALAASALAGTVAQAGTVRVLSDNYPASTLNNFYNTFGGHTSQIVTGSIDTIDLTGVDLFWAIQPADAYTVGEIGAMANYLAGGGRIAFMGEHGGFLPNENNRINAALAALGSTISIVNTTSDPGFRSASVTDGQILANPLTAGVNSYQYAAFAPLITSGSAQTLMIGEENPSDIMMAYQNIGAGSIFLITDQNVWDNAATLWGNFDNEILFDNLVQASTVPVVPEPATWAMMLVGFGMIGATARYRRRQTAVRFA